MDGPAAPGGALIEEIVSRQYVWVFCFRVWDQNRRRALVLLTYRAACRRLQTLPRYQQPPNRALLVMARRRLQRPHLYTERFFDGLHAPSSHVARVLHRRAHHRAPIHCRAPDRHCTRRPSHCVLRPDGKRCKPVARLGSAGAASIGLHACMQCPSQQWPPSLPTFGIAFNISVLVRCNTSLLYTGMSRSMHRCLNYKNKLWCHVHALVAHDMPSRAHEILAQERHNLLYSTCLSARLLAEQPLAGAFERKPATCLHGCTSLLLIAMPALRL